MAITPHLERIIRFKIDGLSNAEIAQKMNIGVKTVSVHLNNIYGELGVSNVGQLTKKATELGISPYLFKTLSATTS